MAQAPPMQQVGGFFYGYAPPLMWMNEIGQNLGENTVDPITISDLDDPKEQEKFKKNRQNNLKIMRFNGSLSSLKNA